jgi:predicted nuclease of predicted toxin-antitoxin system
VKLLFDQNLSWRLSVVFFDRYPGSVHVRDIGLATADDAAVWEYARSHDLTIVTKDADFHQRSFVLGSPPRVVWIRRGNCSTDAIIDLLNDRRDTIDSFARNPEAAFLVLT